MKVGDTKKAIVLSAVALVVVGAAIFQIIPKTPKVQAAVVARAEGQVAATTEKKVNEELPTTLTSQPFSKPKPVPPPDAQPPQAPTRPETQKGVANLPGHMPALPSDDQLKRFGLARAGSQASADDPGIPNEGALPGAGPGPKKDLLVVKGGSLDGKNPGENTADSRQQKGGHPTLTFNGVMEVNGRTAMITISQKTETTLECKVGSRVLGFVVTEIAPDCIVLRHGNVALKLTVGSSQLL